MIRKMIKSAVLVMTLPLAKYFQENGYTNGYNTGKPANTLFRFR
jgi:hypothetical protein